MTTITSKHTLPAPGDEQRKKGECLKRLTQRFRIFGFSETTGFVLKSSLRKVLGYLEKLYYCRDLELPLPVTTQEFHFNWLNGENFAADEHLMSAVSQLSLLRSPQNIETAFNRGDECLCLFDGENLVHVRWVQWTHSFPILGIPTEKAAYLYGARTQLGARGRGANQESLIHIIERARQRGFQRIIVGVGFDNAINRYCLEKLGFKIIERRRSFKGGLISFVTTKAKKVEWC